MIAPPSLSAPQPQLQLFGGIVWLYRACALLPLYQLLHWERIDWSVVVVDVGLTALQRL